jgi:hypothetical protein
MLGLAQFKARLQIQARRQRGPAAALQILARRQRGRQPEPQRQRGRDHDGMHWSFVVHWSTFEVSLLNCLGRETDARLLQEHLAQIMPIAPVSVWISVSAVCAWVCLGVRACV